MLTEVQKIECKNILATKAGFLKKNLGYVPLSLMCLFDGLSVSPIHVGVRFPKTFYDVLHVLDLEIEEDGSLDEHEAMLTKKYSVKLKNKSCFSFFDLLECCDIKDTETHSFWERVLVRMREDQAQ